MKTYALSILLNILIVVSLHGKIRNGYEAGIYSAREGLKNLNALLHLDSNLSIREKKRIKENIARHKDFIMYHELTERLLLQFKMIAPDIYDEMDTIKDARGRSVDVYVKFVALESMRGSVAGSSNIPTGEDRDAYNSKYGLHTASVRIITGKNALTLLAHEFGHLQYQIPNIGDYHRFFTSTYLNNETEYEETGHHHMDPSGHRALKFERRFYSKYFDYLKIKQNREENPLVMIQEISRNLQ